MIVKKSPRPICHVTWCSCFLSVVFTANCYQYYQQPEMFLSELGMAFRWDRHRAAKKRKRLKTQPTKKQSVPVLWMCATHARTVLFNAPWAMSCSAGWRFTAARCKASLPLNSSQTSCKCLQQWNPNWAPWKPWDDVFGCCGWLDGAMTAAQHAHT